MFSCFLMSRDAAADAAMTADNASYYNTVDIIVV